MHNDRLFNCLILVHLHFSLADNKLSSRKAPTCLGLKPLNLFLAPYGRCKLCDLVINQTHLLLGNTLFVRLDLRQTLIQNKVCRLVKLGLLLHFFGLPRLHAQLARLLLGDFAGSRLRAKGTPLGFLRKACTKDVMDLSLLQLQTCVEGRVLKTGLSLNRLFL